MAATADRDQRKREAAERALQLVKPGMKLGLGSGSTARIFVDLVGERVKAGLDVHCVATSEATAEQAKALGIPLGTLDDIPELDLTVDGADEVDPKLRLIKGGGGALLREKIVASASKRMAVIANSKKLVPTSAPFRCRSRWCPSVSLRRGVISSAPSLSSSWRDRSVCAATPPRSSPMAAILFLTAPSAPFQSPRR